MLVESLLDDRAAQPEQLLEGVAVLLPQLRQLLVLPRRAELLLLHPLEGVGTRLLLALQQLSLGRLRPLHLPVQPRAPPLLALERRTQLARLARPLALLLLADMWQEGCEFGDARGRGGAGWRRGPQRCTSYASRTGTTASSAVRSSGASMVASMASRLYSLTANSAEPKLPSGSMTEERPAAPTGSRSASASSNACCLRRATSCRSDAASLSALSARATAALSSTRISSDGSARFDPRPAESLAAVRRRGRTAPGGGRERGGRERRAARGARRQAGGDGAGRSREVSRMLGPRRRAEIARDVSEIGGD